MSAKTLQFGLPPYSRDQRPIVPNLIEVSYVTVQLPEVVGVNVPKLNQEKRKICVRLPVKSSTVFLSDAPDPKIVMEGEKRGGGRTEWLELRERTKSNII